MLKSQPFMFIRGLDYLTPLRSRCGGEPVKMAHTMSDRTGQTALMILTAGVGLVGVGLGAAGAHALKQTLTENKTTEMFQTALFYQMVHLWLPYVCVWLRSRYRSPLAPMAGWVVIIGVVLFSGSLYVRALGGPVLSGAAPVGGLLLMLGWGLMLLAPLSPREEA